MRGVRVDFSSLEQIGIFGGAIAPKMASGHTFGIFIKR